MCKPGRETVAGIIAHRTLLGRGAECVGNPLRGPLVIGREGDPDMAIVEYGVVLAIGLLDLVEALGDQEGPHAVARQEGQAGLEEVQRSEEHTSEPPVTNANIVCSLLLEKNNTTN